MSSYAADFRGFLKQRGVLAVRNALFNQCILGTWRILRENQALNPSTIEDLMHSVARINRVARTHSNSLK